MARLWTIAIFLTAFGVAHADDPPERPPIVIYDYVPRWALPTDTGHSVGYHVGGGNPFPRRAEPRFNDEGTWGWDYQGWLLPRRVISGWWHGRRYQGGTGAYQTDGPRLYR